MIIMGLLRNNWLARPLYVRGEAALLGLADHLAAELDPHPWDAVADVVCDQLRDRVEQRRGLGAETVPGLVLVQIERRVTDLRMSGLGAGSDSWFWFRPHSVAYEEPHHLTCTLRLQAHTRPNTGELCLRH